MNVGAVGAIASGGGSVYAALSPYLNGVQRPSDTAIPVQPDASAVTASVAADDAARATAASAAPPGAPFLNPAIAEIAARAWFAGLPSSATDPVLYGDSGLLIQSYGAVALLTGPLVVVPAYRRPVSPAVSATVSLAAYPRTAPIDYTA